MTMKIPTKFAIIILVSLIGSIMLISNTYSQPPDYSQLKSEAERLYAEGSYGLAHDLYLKADALELPPEESRWVDFRLADTLWRSQAATQTADTTKLDQAREQLEGLIRDIQRPEDRDRVWVEVQESLGDFWWTRRMSRNWGQAWPHYQQALDWWAGARDIELARQRYLDIVWTMSEPPDIEPHYYYSYYGNVVPLEILENVLKIAQSFDDQARAHYLMAMTIRYQRGDWNQLQRVPEEFEAALKAGTRTDWYDDALYHYAEWMAGSGRVIETDGGGWRTEPDYVRAVELFRQLTIQFRKGETRYYDQAQRQIENITKPVVGVGVSNIFLPESEIQYHLNWRNVKRVDLVLYRIDLVRDVRFPDAKREAGDWLQQIDLTGRERVKSWSKETEDKGDYKPGQEAMRLDGKLPLGAYLLEARAGGERARDLILVTDVSVVVKTSGNQALVYFCNALDGSPIANGTIKVWQPMYDDDEWRMRESSKQTNQDGLAIFDLARTRHYRNLFVSAALSDRQAYSGGYSMWRDRDDDPWRIYAFTDRPAYRPGEKVQWKIIARRYNGSVYSTPSNQAIEYEITDPRGSKTSDGKAVLNTFGSAWGSLDVTDAMPLGEYRVKFWDEGRNRRIGDATLFRLEEYKLPEFKVTVQTPEENGKKKSFRLGESVEVNIQADYYFGGPVATARVEVLVYQSPFRHWWFPPREFPWFYEDVSLRSRYPAGQGEIVKRETLTTDASGKAALTFDTPRGGQQDFEYRIEARVTDASRREIIGSGTVRVTRQRYYVYLRPQHSLSRPQDKVTIDVKALDASNQPQLVEGTITLTRDSWIEIWIDPTGKEVRGEELHRLRQTTKVFPPPPRASGDRPWRLKFRGYEHDDILTRPIKTDANGEAEFTFTPEREGYYRIAWTSKDRDRAPIKSETTVWVATNATTELGYRHGGLEIIVDKDTFRAGQKAPVMVNVPTNDRYVLFSVEGEDLSSYQLIHLTGTVKLVEVPIGPEHVPNIFLGAAMVTDRQLYTDTKEVVVPPVEHFLTVDVTSDRAEYQPRENGTLTVTTRDHNGNPVSAEVALGFVDESIYYIQQDYAGDPRQFYFGRKRSQNVRIQSTFQQKSYTKLIEGERKDLIDAFRADLSGVEEEDRRYAAVVGGVPGGVVGGLTEGEAASKAFAAPAAARNEAVFVAKDEVMAQEAAPPATPPGGEEPAVQVRTDFRATVFWQPDVVTGADGRATVKVTFPDSLTTWKATARVATRGNEFGIATAGARTNKPLIVRLQAPRFFVVGDEVTISAVINNNTDDPMMVTPSLSATGVVITGILRNGRPVKGEWGPIRVGSHSEARADWVTSVQNPGLAELRVMGRSSRHADAMEKAFPVYEHGIEKFVATSGKVRGDDVTVRLNIPKDRKPESTSVTVQVTPSTAVMMLDALPYLIDYPYGCTEQTMSRFLPAAITAKTLKDLGLKPEEIMGRIFGGIEQSTADQTHRRGKQDLRKLEDMINQGLDRLYDFQHSDGGWGWWKEGDSDHFMTAYVVWGLTLARDAGIDVRTNVLDRGLSYLDQELVEEETHPDAQAWMLHALAVHHASRTPSGISQFQRKAFDNLWANRDKLNAYTRALLALSAHYYDQTDRARTLVRNLDNGVKIDRTPDTSVVLRGRQESSGAAIGTAHWGEDGIYRRWSDGGVESTAFALRALLAIDPQNALIEPVTNWLVKNRRGAQWSNTRDTAIVVLTLNEYLRSSGELNPSMEYELYVNNQSIASRKLTSQDVLSAPSQYQVPIRLIKDGANEIRIVRRSGQGPIYFAVHAEFFSLEEPVTAVGHEIFVRRHYYKLVGRPTLLKGYVYDREPLEDGGSVMSGERIETIITVEAKNNYEYLVFEDLKPAGLEAVQVRSGEPLFAREVKAGAVETLLSTPPEPRSKIYDPRTTNHDYTGRSRWVYQELRDRKVAMFIDKLPEGVWEIRYTLRAEVPGAFHALPVMAHAMYVPEIRGNGEELRLSVGERKD